MTKPGTKRGGKRGSSRVVTAIRARREHGSISEAIRAADPDSLRGLAARQATLGAMASWDRRHELAPVTATVTTLAAGAIWPGWTTAGLAAGAVCQSAARKIKAGTWSQAERSAAAGWASGAAGWTFMQTLMPGTSWWLWAAGLITVTGAQSVLWWRASADPAEAGPEPSIYERALLTVLGELTVDGGPLTAARLAGIRMPADRVVVAEVALGYGVHAEDVPQEQLRRTVEARAQVPRKGVQVDVVDTNTIRITASWSNALDSGSVLWEPGRAGDGEAWIGVADDRRDIVLRAYTVGEADGKVRAHHGWIVGRTGGGKSTTLAAILLPGLMAGTEMVFVADGKGDSLDKLEPHTARYARTDGARFEQVITLVWAIMRSRQTRGWHGPTPADPLITLVIDEATTVKENIDAYTQGLVYEIGRMGESLGVRSIQGLQIPTIDGLIGEGGWRANTRWVIGHVSADPTYSSIAAQSTNEDVSLLGLPTGRAAVIFEGEIVARRAKMAFVGSEDIARAMHGVAPAQLHPADMALVQPLWDLTAHWSTPAALTSAPKAADLRLARWAPDPATTAAPPIPVPAYGSPQPQVPAARQASAEDEPMGCDAFTTGGQLRLVPADGVLSPAVLPGAGTARDWVITYLARQGPSTAAQMLQVSHYGRSTLFDALKVLVQDEVIGKRGDTYTTGQFATGTAAGQ